MITNNMFSVFAIGKLFERSYPKHSLDTPDSAEELMKPLDHLKDPKSGHKKAGEVKNRHTFLSGNYRRGKSNTEIIRVTTD